MSQSTILSPYEQAMRVYEQEECKRTFAEDLDLHLRYGYVYSDPRLFIMGRPVCLSGSPADIVNPMVKFSRDHCDCWHVYLAAGDLNHFFEIEPYILPYLSWEKRNVLRVHPRSRLIQLCQSNLQSFSTKELENLQHLHLPPRLRQ